MNTQAAVDPTTRRAPAGAAAQRPGPVREMTVLYDQHCPVCRRARWWVEHHDAYLPLRFTPAGGPDALAQYPDLDHATTLKDITVITDTGQVHRGDAAWITVLWALRSTRSLANQLAAGRKQRVFGTVVGATELARKMIGKTPMPPLPPPPPATRPTRSTLDVWMPPNAEAECDRERCR